MATKKAANESKPAPPVSDLADELFNLVEYDQGRGFVSDGMGALQTHEDFFNTVRTHLQFSDSAVKKMRRFLKKYGQPGR